MMQLKRFFLLILAIMMFCVPYVSQAEEEAQNLIQNPGFEELDGEGLPLHWHTDAYVKQEGYTLYDVSADARTGQHSAVVNNMGMNDARFVQKVRVEPESLYRLSGWIKVEDMTDSGRGANLSVEGLYLFTEGLYTPDGLWHYVEMYGETGEDQHEVTIFARVGGYSGESQGSALFDDLSLVEVDEVPGDGVAALWFKHDAPLVQVDPIDYVEEQEASPFWPWLVVTGVVYAAACWLMSTKLHSDERELQPRSHAPLFFVVGMVVAAVARMVVAALVEGYQVDVNCFRSWGHTMASVGPTQFYQSTSFCDYTPAYLYVLGLNEHLTRLGSLLGLSVNAAFYHKLVPMACDLAGAYVLYRVALQEKFTRNQAGLLGLALALNPAMFLNSAAWCQMDAVLCLGLLLVGLMAVRRQWMLLLPTYVLCALIKPQALMLGPLGLVVLVVEFIRCPESRKPMYKGLALAAGVAALVIVPFSIHQQPGWLIEKYSATLASYPYATVNTTNFYYLFNANWASIDASCGVLPPLCLGLGCAAWAVVVFLRQKGKKLFWLESALLAAFALAFMAMALLDVSWLVMGSAAMALCFALVLPMYLRSGNVRHVPLLGAVLFILLYVIGIKMHERYLFPALLLLGLAFALQRDGRILLLLGVSSAVMLVNEGIVLDNALRLGASMGHLNEDTHWLNMLLSVVNVATVPLALWTAQRICVEDAKPLILPSVAKRLPLLVKEELPCKAETFAPDHRLHWKRLDWLLMLSVTLVYSVVALCNLGSTKAPQTAWTSTHADECVTIDLGQHYDDFSMLYFCEVSYNDFSIATSEDGEGWSEEYWAEMNQGQCYRWKYLAPSFAKADGSRSYLSVNELDDVQRLSGRYVRLTAHQINLRLNEVIFRDADGRHIPAEVVDVTGAREESPLLSDASAILDEQDSLEGEPGWFNSTYFDEIYHARTAHEHLRGTVPYETSHPPLGKVLMSWAVAIFGMTPFGWRFAGALAGILMLPAMYVLGKQLTKKSSMAFAAMFLMAVDCMHLTQTRIATIDSFPVLFIILSYLFMARFMQRDIVLQPVRSILPDLALSGFFMGCSIASKWIGVYAGAGLAVLYFWTCFRHLRMMAEAKGALAAGVQDDTLAVRANESFRRVVQLCLWCLLFFVAVPVIIYLLSYIPYFAYAHKDGLFDYLEMVINAQLSMFDYHATPGLGMDHPFHSPWYEWPLIERPMYYAMAHFTPAGYSQAIFCFGNPAVWLAGLAGLTAVALVWCKRHVYALEGRAGILHLRGEKWDIAPAFVLIGFLAQFLPWVLVPRGTYIYHYFASVPFLILSTVLAFHWLCKRWPKWGKLLLFAFLAVSLVCFIGFYPYASGVLTPTWWLDFMKQFLTLYYG